MNINICLPNNGASRAFKMDLRHPVSIAYAWERIVGDCQGLYEKELSSLVALNLLCFAIRHTKDFRSIDRLERFHIACVLKMFCKYVKDVVYVEVYHD